MIRIAIAIEMPPDRAVIDRITDGVALLLSGPDGAPRHVDADVLPSDATEGSVVKIDSSLNVIKVDHQLTEQRASAATSRLARIRAERTGHRFS